MNKQRRESKLETNMNGLPLIALFFPLIININIVEGE